MRRGPNDHTVAFWTVAGGVATVLALVITIGAAVRSCGRSPQDNLATPAPTQSISSSVSQAAPTPVTSKSRQAATVTYLSDLTPVGGVAQPLDPSGTNVNISGTDYAHSVPIFCVSGRVNDLEYNLEGRGKRFIGEVGIGDTEDASGLSAFVSFYADGQLIDTVHVSLAHPKAVSLNVSGIFRLRIAAQLVQTGGDARSITVSVGNARYTS